VRIPKSAARKRRLAVLRQIASTDVDEPGDFSGPVSLELPSEERDFSAACGSRLPLRLAVRNERSGETEDVLIDRPWMVIGGAENCDLRVLHPDISQRHVYLQFAEGRLFACDLASRTGTHWSTDGRSSGWVNPGEPIYLGPYSIRPFPNEFLADAPSDAAGDDRGYLPGDCPPAAFTIGNVVDRSGRPKMRRIRRTVTLAGASQICPLRLQHASVGRVHCSFVWTPCGLWVVDLLCNGGTSVNGRPVSLARLNEGDEVAVGRFQLQLTYAPPAEEEPAASVPPESAGDLPAADPPRLVDSSIIPRTTSPPIVFASVDTDSEPEPARMAAEPIVEMVPTIEAGTIDATSSETDRACPPRAAPAPPPEAVNGLTEFRPAPLQLPPDHSLSEPVAMAIMEQFSAMQQQFYDHTQQLLAAMTQTFSAVHTRQLELIRAELFRVHEVNRQLQELNLELTISRQSQSEAVDSPPRSEPNQPIGHAPLREPRSGSSRFSRDEPRPPRSGRGRSGARSLEARKIDPPTPQTGAGGAGTDDLLSDRIRELEQEQTDRWQKIMQILTPAGSALSPTGRRN